MAPLAAMNADPEVMRYFPSPLEPRQSYRAAADWADQLAQREWGIWALERRDSGAFVGLAGLAVARSELPFSPCIEVLWRLVRHEWGQGLATEAAIECLRVGFVDLRLERIVAFTAGINQRSRAVMTRIGLHDTGAAFDHPALPADSPLRRHCLYDAARGPWITGPWGERSTAP